MTEAVANQEPTSRLAHFPVSFFTVTMGLLGTALALRAASPVLSLPAALHLLVLALSAMAFVALGAAYALKLLTKRHMVLKEWQHPIRVGQFPTFPISVLLLAAGLVPVWHDLAVWLWVIGTILQVVSSAAVVGSWISDRTFQHSHLTPGWFVPVVGNAIVPIAGAKLGFVEVSWVCFSAGVVLWFTLLPVVFGRLIFNEPMPIRMAPTLMVLAAPPAVACIAWFNLAGTFDHFCHFLLGVGLVFAVLVLTQIRSLRKMSFSIASWALSFPLAALTTATFIYVHETGSHAGLAVATALLVLLLAVVSVLSVYTLRGILNGSLFHPE